MRRVSDKRRHPRFDGVGLWARVKMDGELCEAVIENISLGGALVGLRTVSPTSRNLLVELRGAQRDLRLVGRIVGVEPRSRHRENPAARVRFNPSSTTSLDQLYALIRGLPKESSFSSSPTDPEAFEFHQVKLRERDDDFDIDVVEDTAASSHALQ